MIYNVVLVSGIPQSESVIHINISVTESGVRLLAAQKPIKKQGWWKGNFALFWMLATGEGGGLTPVQRLTPFSRQSGIKSIYRQREGVTCRNSTVSSESHLEIGHWWSNQCHLDGFKYN